MRIKTEHKLLTSSWTADVAELETAIGRFTEDPRVVNDCSVVLFESPRDEDLHVNVTHKHKTVAVKGWAGPGVVLDGFVHNRTFDTPQSGIIRHIHDMVFAAKM